MILDVLIVVTLMILSFVAGMTVANHYHNATKAEIKEALQRQYLRLQARMDADDPCGPYMHELKPVPKACDLNTGDFDGDEQFEETKPGPIDNSFMTTLLEKGKAVTKFKKSDIAT